MKNPINRIFTFFVVTIIGYATGVGAHGSVDTSTLEYKGLTGRDLVEIENSIERIMVPEHFHEAEDRIMVNGHMESMEAFADRHIRRITYILSEYPHPVSNQLIESAYFDALVINQEEDKLRRVILPVDYAIHKTTDHTSELEHRFNAKDVARIKRKYRDKSFGEQFIKAGDGYLHLFVRNSHGQYGYKYKSIASSLLRYLGAQACLPNDAGETPVDLLHTSQKDTNFGLEVINGCSAAANNQR